MTGKEMIKDRLRKLIAHEQSARKIGNTAEAAAYASHVKTLLRRHKLTKKSLREPAQPQVQSVSGIWICICGATIKLNISAEGSAAVSLANALLAPHTGAGHILTRT